MRCSSRDRQNFSHFGPIFALLPPNNQENQNFEKMKEASADVIILQMCVKNCNHMIYASCDMECDRHNFLSFFALLTPLLTLKIKFGKNVRKLGDIILLRMCNINEDHVMYGS